MKIERLLMFEEMAALTLTHLTRGGGGRGDGTDRQLKKRKTEKQQEKSRQTGGQIKRKQEEIPFRQCGFGKYNCKQM